MSRAAGQFGGNRREARAVLRDRFPDYQPIIEMAQMAQDKNNSPELRFQAHKEIQSYLTPKLKAIEVTGSGGGPIVIQGVTGDAAL